MTKPAAPVPCLDAHGARLPTLGLGTSKLRGADCVRAVETALELGYRAIDTAVMYGNEVEVGAGLRASALARDDVFVTTKVLPGEIDRGALQASAQASLERLKLDQVDLLLIHWPNRAIPLARSIEALCDARQRGLTRAIGVANFPVALLEEAVRLAAAQGERLATNQCEYHPRLAQPKLLAACRRHGIVLVSYCPLGQGRLMSDPVITRIAAQHGRTPAQVVLRWHVQQEGVAAIPKSASRDHLAENLGIFDFALSDADMQALHALAVPDGRIINPAFGPDWDR